MLLAFVERVTLDGFTYQAYQSYDVPDALALKILNTFQGGEVAIVDTITVDASAVPEMAKAQLLAEEQVIAPEPSAEAVAEVDAIGADAAQELADALSEIETPALMVEAEDDGQATEAQADEPAVARPAKASRGHKGKRG